MIEKQKNGFIRGAVILIVLALVVAIVVSFTRGGGLVGKIEGGDGDVFTPRGDTSVQITNNEEGQSFAETFIIVHKSKYFLNYLNYYYPEKIRQFVVEGNIEAMREWLMENPSVIDFAASSSIAPGETIAHSLTTDDPEALVTVFGRVENSSDVGWISSWPVHSDTVSRSSVVHVLEIRENQTVNYKRGVSSSARFSISPSE